MTWETTTLGEAGDWASGGTPSTSNPSFWDGDIPWMSSKSLTRFFVNDSDRRLTPLGASNGTKLVPKDTILMVVRGMSLKTEFRMGITQREVALSQDLKALRPSGRFDPLFLAYALKARKADVLDIVDEAGHGTGRLQSDRLFALTVPVPPLHEQRSIAATLGALDNKIESDRRLVRHSQDLLDVTSEARCASLPSTPLGHLSGLTRATVSPAALSDSLVDHYSLPAFDTSGRPERVRPSRIMSNKIRLDGSAILVSRLNPRISRMWWVQRQGRTAALASTEFAVLSAPAALELGAIWLAVRHPSFIDELPRRVTGTSGSHQRVRPNDLLAIEVPDVRQLDDGTKGTALRLLRLIHQRREESTTLAVLRDALLPELLSGRIRVPEAADVVQDELNESESA